MEKLTLVFFRNGIYEKDRKKIIQNYVKTREGKLDLFSLLPLDLLYLYTGYQGRATILRFPRLLRYYNFPRFFDRLDAMLPFPVFIR